jgi:hypothetical protein
MKPLAAECEIRSADELARFEFRILRAVDSAGCFVRDTSTCGGFREPTRSVRVFCSGDDVVVRIVTTHIRGANARSNAVAGVLHTTHAGEVYR